MNDVQTRTDIDLVMRVFYEDAVADDVIGFIFTDVARLDLAHHLPMIGDFWESVLFGATAYAMRGRNPLEVHSLLDAKIRLTDEHFRRWIELFCSSIDNEFRGPRAEFLKTRARSIASRMQTHLAESRCPVVTATTSSAAPSSPAYRKR
jgi:hemoglobin